MKNKYLQKILDLKAKKKTYLDAAAAANDKGDITAYDAAMQNVANVQAEIDRTQAIVDAMDDSSAGTPTPTPVPATAASPASSIRASNEYANAFAWALAHGVNPGNAREVSDDRKGILMAALTETGGTPEGANGGFLVPEDVETRIRELRRALNPLADLFTVETVTTRTGFRVLDTAPNKGFTKISEMGEVAKDDQPAFTRVPFAVEDYAGILPISNDLLEDNTAGLLAYLARWFAKKGVLTENAVLYPMLRGLPATKVSASMEIISIKTALNLMLDPAISVDAKLITNQAGLNTLDNLMDDSGNPLLQPDLTQPTRMVFAGRPVHVYPNSQMPNLNEGAPLYIGDPRQLATLFRRKGLEVASTTIGGNAWSTNSTEMRGIMRLCATKFDTDAVKALTLPTP